MGLKILIIVNPISGRKKRDKYYNKIVANLKQQGFESEIKFTTQEQNAEYIIKNYKEHYDLVIVCGGDGTLNHTMQGLYEINKNVPVGFIPCGTTNDYARSLKISFNKQNLSKNIKNYISTQIDLGLFNERTFNYAATFGIFSKTSYNVSRKMKNAIGRLAYILSGIKEVFTYKTYKMKICYDDKTIEDDFAFGSITNSHYVGGFYIFRKEEIKLDDGNFEVLLIKKPKNIIDTIRMIIKIIRGNFKDKDIYYLKTNQIYIESLSEDCGWSIDGEYGGTPKKINIINKTRWSQY